MSGTLSRLPPSFEYARILLHAKGKINRIALKSHPNITGVQHKQNQHKQNLDKYSERRIMHYKLFSYHNEHQKWLII